MAELFTRSARVKVCSRWKRLQSWCVSAGDPQMTNQQMTDHCFGTSESIHSGAVAIGRQSLTLKIIRESSHNSDGGGS